jgi:hypothetical protein
LTGRERLKERVQIRFKGSNKVQRFNREREGSRVQKGSKVQ